MEEELKRKICPICGVVYAAPVRFFTYRQELPSTHKNCGWYCPNGHRLIFTESEADKQRRRAERAEQCLAQRDEEIHSLENQNRVIKGHVTRLKKRSAAGVCPCCRRSFQNLRRHMEGQHPDFAKEDEKKVA